MSNCSRTIVWRNLALSAALALIGQFTMSPASWAIDQADLDLAHISSNNQCVQNLSTGNYLGTWNPMTFTCTLITDVNAGILIDSNQITLDCAGHSVTANIDVNHVTGVTVENCVMLNGTVGISVNNSSQVRVLSNTITNFQVGGIATSFSTNVEIADNKIQSSVPGSFALNTNQFGGSSALTVHGNLINGPVDLNGLSNSLFYNNEFFGLTSLANAGVTSTSWNVSPTSATNILGGSIVAGNAYLQADGLGFSQTCPDKDRDGICDCPNVLDPNNIDNFPLAQIGPNTGTLHCKKHHHTK